jgi:hypothetical protein
MLGGDRDASLWGTMRARRPKVVLARDVSFRQ